MQAHERRRDQPDRTRSRPGHPHSPSPTRSAGGPDVRRLIALQAAAGNQAVYRLLRHPTAFTVQRVNENLLNAKDKGTFHKLKKAVEDHNLKHPGNKLNFEHLNNRSAAIPDLIRNVKAAIAKAEAEIASYVPMPQNVDPSQLVAIEPSKRRDVAPAPKPKQASAPRVLSEKEQLEQSLNEGVGSGAPVYQQRYDTVEPVSNQLIDGWTGANAKPAGFQLTMGDHIPARMTQDTVYFAMTIVHTVNAQTTRTYNFELHYHPSKTGNWLHPKRSAAASADHQIAAAHWLVNLPKLKAGRLAWNQAFGLVAPTLP